MFDFIVDQLLELVRQAIYRRARRPMPAPGAASRSKVSAPKEKTAPARSKARRRAFNPLGNPLVLGLTVVLAFLVYRRMSRRP